MDFLKTVTGKVVGGIVGLVVIIAAISWWRMDPATKQMLLSGTGKIVSWLGIVLVAPWATFFTIAWVGRMRSNRAGGILVFTYTALEVMLLAYLFNWKMPGATALTFFTLGALFAAVYNLLVCDWLAEKLEG